MNNTITIKKNIALVNWPVKKVIQYLPTVFNNSSPPIYINVHYFIFRRLIVCKLSDKKPLFKSNGSRVSARNRVKMQFCRNHYSFFSPTASSSTTLVHPSEVYFSVLCMAISGAFARSRDPCGFFLPFIIKPSPNFSFSCSLF